jgi:hypothetical protein
MNLALICYIIAVVLFVVAASGRVRSFDLVAAGLAFFAAAHIAPGG